MSDIPLTTTPSQKNKISIVKDFLLENYDIKINVFDPSRPIIKSKIKEYVHPVEFNDIYLHLKDEDINVSASDLRMLIMSRNQMQTTNPIAEYFMSLDKAYKGISHMDMFIDHLDIVDFGDREDNYYENRARLLFRKWIVSTAACALGIKQNEVALGFIAPGEGIGKTYLTEFITPQVLTDYYLNSKSDDKFDLELEFSRNLIINFDELVGVGQGNAEEFKKVLSAKEFQFRSRCFAQKTKRIASATFTSNRNRDMGGFITTNMGYRRYGCIEINSIDWAYSTKVDVNQIWAEAMMLLQSSTFDFVFSREDFREFEEYNSKYIKQDNAHSLISEYFSIPESNDADGVEFMQPIDIIKSLNNARKIKSNMTNITEVTVGQALKALGFKKVQKRVSAGPRYGYLVTKNF